MLEACEVIDPARVMHTSCCDCLHTAGAPFFTEVPSVVIGEAQDVEAGIAVVVRVSGRRAKQVARVRVAALLAGLATVDKHAFEVAERDVGS